MIKGITVTLFQRTKTGTDAFNAPIYTETPVSVSDVLVAPLSDEEILDTLNLTGRRAKYQLGIPKGDTHDWEGCTVAFFGELWRVIGHPTEGIDDMIPLRWNKKVKVESIAQDIPVPSAPIAQEVNSSGQGEG